MRNVSITITGFLPINGHKAVVELVDNFEERITRGETLAAIDSVATPGTEVRVFQNGANYERYAFDITGFDPETGEYALTVV